MREHLVIHGQLAHKQGGVDQLIEVAPGCILHGYSNGMQIIQVKLNLEFQFFYFFLSHFRMTKVALLSLEKKYLEKRSLIIQLSIFAVDVQGAPQLS